MATPELCPVCGAALPPQAAAGLCPGCLLREGLSGDGPPGDSTDFSVGSIGAGALATLAATVGPLPRVLLRDTDAGTEPPLVRPGSTELPAPADRPARLQLLGEIARGGMGAILKGRDTDLGRDLAVKVLLEAHRDRPEMVHRFIEEAQIGGQLQHPGIVPVYELGAFADARPYFAMKLVKGRTLADILAARSDPAEDRPRLLATFLAVAQTVAYAHARGVIHRDLKPSNVMVGSFGEVQVMDWGLAKVLARGGAVADAAAGAVPGPESLIATVRSEGDSDLDRSVAGSVMGTPAYMAPEQARGEVVHIDERVDVFALGSILCEVLTGQPAFTGHTAVAIQRQAARAELGGALQRIEACGADAELVALVRRCLAEEPADRPRDAGAVAESVAGYLASLQERMRQAELARAAESARADAERHRRKLALALAASVLALVTLGGGTSWSVVQQRRDRAARFDLALREVEVLRDQAAADPEGDVAKWREARRVLNDVAGRVGQGAGLPASSHGRLAALERQVEQGEAAAEADRRLVARLEEIRATFDLDEGADTAFRTAFEAAGLDPERLTTEAFVRKLSARPAAVARATAEALDAWFLIRTGQGRAPRDGHPQAAGRPLIDAARSIDPDPWRRGLREALARSDLATCRKLADDPARPAQGPAIQWLLALGLEILGDHPRAVETLRAAALRYPEDYWINTALGTGLLAARRFGPGAGDLERIFGVLAPWGPTRAEREQGSRAEPYLRAAVALRRQFGPARLNLAMALADQGRFGEALAVTREGLRLLPGDPRLLYETGFILLRQDQHAEAVAVHRELVRLHPDSPRAHFALAATLWGQTLFKGTAALDPATAWDAAAAEARAAIKLGPDEPLAHFALGEILKRQRRHDEAIRELRQAVRLRPEFSLAHAILGEVLLMKGSVDEAIAECREAIRLLADSPQSRITLGDAMKRQGKLAEAIAEWQEGFRLHPENLMLQVRLGGGLEAKGDLDGAIAVYREAFRLRRSDKISTPLRRAYGQKVRALLARGDVDGATAMLQDEFRVIPDREVLAGLIKALKARNNPDAAMAYFDGLIRDRPEEQFSWLARAAYLVEVARPDEAAADLATAVRDWPREPTAWLERGRLEVRRGHPDEAAAAYARLLELSPAPGDPWRNTDDAGSYAAAAADAEVFDRLLGLLPGNRALLVARFGHLAGRREWKAAAEVLARLNALEPPDSLSLQREADLRSWLGDDEGYRRVCRRMLERFGATSDPTIARRTLASCLLRDDAIPQRRGLAPLLDAIRADPTLRANVWSRISEGLYEYRAGHHAAVFDILSPSSKVAATSSDAIPAALGRLIRSMSHARLGQIAEARQQFATAEAALKPAHFDPGTSGPTPSNWNDWLRFYALRREAEGLLRDAALPDDPFAPGRRP